MTQAKAQQVPRLGAADLRKMASDHLFKMLHEDLKGVAALSLLDFSGAP
jgi:hypothetical protein